MSSVLMSTRPGWCQKICNRIGEENGVPIYEKRIEVRKTKPKLRTPYKVYIYCTNDRKVFLDSDCNDKFWTEKNYGGKHYYNGKVIGEFVCDGITEYRAEFTDLEYPDAQHKKVCQNTIKRVERDDENEETFYRYETSNEEDNPDDCKFLKESCLTFNEVRKYIGETFFDKPFYGWHISDLKIYDKPKELSEFRKYCGKVERFEVESVEFFEYCYNCPNLVETDSGLCSVDCGNRLERPPQSWCYVEELK